VRTLINAFQQLCVADARSVDGAVFLARAAQSGPLGALLARFFAGQAPRDTIDDAELTFALAVCCSGDWKDKAQALCTAVCTALKRQSVAGGVSKPELFLALSFMPLADAPPLRLAAQPALQALLERAFAGEEGGGCSLVPGPGQTGGGGAAAAAAAVTRTHLTFAALVAWFESDAGRLLEVQSLPPLFTEKSGVTLEGQFSNLTTAAQHTGVPSGAAAPRAAATYAPSTQAYNAMQHMRPDSMHKGLFHANIFRGQQFDSDLGGMGDVSPVHPRCDDPAQPGFVGVVVLLGAINTEELAFTIVAAVIWCAYLANAGLGKCGPSIGALFRRMVAGAANGEAGDATAARAAAVKARARGWTQSADTILGAQLTLGSLWHKLETQEMFVVKAIDCSSGIAHISPAKLMGVCIVESAELCAIVLALPVWMQSPGPVTAFGPPSGYSATCYVAQDLGWRDAWSFPVQITVPIDGGSSGKALLEITLPASQKRTPGWHSFEGATVKCAKLDYEVVGAGSALLEQDATSGDRTVSAVRIRYACDFGHFDAVLQVTGASTFQPMHLDSHDLCYCACLIMHSGLEVAGALEICRQTHSPPEIRASIAAAEKLVTDPCGLTKLSASSQLLAGEVLAPIELSDQHEHEYLVLGQGVPGPTSSWGDAIDPFGFPRLFGYYQESRRLSDSSVWRARSPSLSSCAGGTVRLHAGLTASFSAVEMYMLSCGVGESERAATRPTGCCNCSHNLSPYPSPCNSHRVYGCRDCMAPLYRQKNPRPV
jgi:hypothetical protein